MSWLSEAREAMPFGVDKPQEAGGVIGKEGKLGKQGIVLAVIAVLGLLSALSYAFTGNAWVILQGAFLIALGAVVGVPMGLEYPFPGPMKAIFVLGVILAVTVFFLGIRKGNTKLGWVLMVAGVVVWTFFGMAGLGTAT